MTTPGEERWKEMVAQLAARVGMTPLDVEAATEGRVKARDVSDILNRAATPEEGTPPVEDGQPPSGEGSVGSDQ